MAQERALTELGEDKVQEALTNLTFKNIGSGSAFKDPKEAYRIGQIGEAKTIGELDAFDKVASKYGGPRAFAEIIATRNYTALGQALEEYATLRGISLEQAAQEMGKILGTQEAIRTSATGYAIDTVGVKQLEQAEVYNALRNAAEASMVYNFAKTLGYAGTPEDFQGVYKALKSQQSEMSFTLNAEGTKRLNTILKNLGYKNVNFQAGDRVTMVMDEKGNITVASGKRGAERFVIDRQHLESGRLDHIYDKKITEDVRITEKGRSVHIFNETRKTNIHEEINLPYVFKGVYKTPDGQFWHGTFYYTKKDGKWMVVAGEAQNVVDYRTYGEFSVDTPTAKFTRPVVIERTTDPNNRILSQTARGGG